MNKTTNIGWPRIFVEGAAIVASILLAFGIDAWWQDRQTRFDEQQILHGLEEEFVSIHEVLNEHMGEHLQRLQALEKLLFVIDEGQLTDVGSIVEAALLEMMAPTTSDLGNGTLDALLSSGRVEILTNSELRAKLTAWSGVMDEVWDDQVSHSKVVYEIHIPYFVSESVPVGISMRGWYEDWPIPGKPVSEIPGALKRLLEDSRFRVLLEINYGYKRHLTEEFEAAIEAAESILAEIEMSIDAAKY
jgi:hypothetical protein